MASDAEFSAFDANFGDYHTDFAASDSDFNAYDAISAVFMLLFASLM